MIFFHIIVISAGNKNQMNERLKSLNKKLYNSTIEIQGFLSQVLQSYKKSFSSFKPNGGPQDQDQKSLQHSPTIFRKQIVPFPIKNSSTQANTPKKLDQTKKKQCKFVGETQNKNELKQRGKSMDMILERNRGQISSGTKLAVGQHLNSIHQNFSSHHPQPKSAHLFTPQVDAIEQTQFLSQIDHNYVLQHVRSRPLLSQKSKPEEIFDYFRGFAYLFPKPLIKKFKNCLFFGQPRKESMSYNGFLYFFTHKIYYGCFNNECKHGFGVEINIKNSTIYKGNFINGHKTGKFQVFSTDMFYEGYLKKGVYHGYGQLQTPISIYRGQFRKGMRDGEGEEYFFKSGLKLKGKFEMNEFRNQNKEINNFPKIFNAPIKRKEFPKLNMFQFSFHDSSDSDIQILERKDIQVKKKLKIAKIQKEEGSDDDDLLPSPFRRIAYNK